MNDRGSIEGGARFFKIVIFVVADSFLFPTKLNFPEFVNQLMIVSQVTEGFFQFAFEYFVTEVVLFHLSQLRILPLEVGH